MITRTPFRIGDVAPLAGIPDEPDLVRLIATYETSSDYGIAGRAFEITGRTDILVRTYQGTPDEETLARDIAAVRDFPADEMLRIRYTFLHARCLRGDELSQGEQRTLTEAARNGDPRTSFDLLICVPPEGDEGPYPRRWAPNSFAAGLVRALGRRSDASP